MKIKEFKPLELFLKQRFPKLKITKKHENSINQVEKDGFYLYNYLDGLEVHRDDPIIKLCRGLVVREDGKLMNFPFTRFFNYHEKEVDEVDICNADVLEKLDGCVKKNTKISLWNGKDIEIGSLIGSINNWKNKELVGLDEKTGNLIKSKILGVTHKKLGKKWNKIVLSNGKELSCTKDHKIYLNGNWIKSENIKKGDKLLSFNLDLNEKAKQILIGTLIGDTHIRLNGKNSKVSFGQKEKESSQKISKYMERKIPEKLDAFGDNLKINPKLEFKKEIVEVISVEEIADEEIHYDIQTTTGNFFAEGVLIHNSLISCWYDGNNWRVTTRGAFPPALQGVDYNQDFRRLFKSFEKLVPGHTYNFELISVHSRIVTKYDEEFVALIGIRDLDSLQEFNQNHLDEIAAKLEVRRPRRFNATNIDHCRALFKQMRDDEEGLVVVDANFKRFKLKQESYLKMARIIGLKDQDILDYILGKTKIDADFDKISEVKERIGIIKLMYSEFIQKIINEYNEIKEIESQKEFAEHALKFSFSGFLFKLRKGVEFEDIDLKYKQLEKWCKNE